MFLNRLAMLILAAVLPRARAKRTDDLITISFVLASKQSINLSELYLFQVQELFLCLFRVANCQPVPAFEKTPQQQFPLPFFSLAAWIPQGYHSGHRQTAAADQPDDRQEPGAADGDAWPSDEVLSQRVRQLFTLLAQAVVLAESQGLLMPLPGEGLALSERLLQLPPSAGDLVTQRAPRHAVACSHWVMRGARCSVCVCVLFDS